MKRSISFSLLAAAAACGISLGQVYTTPVGYISHTAYGTESSGASKTTSIISPSLVQPNVFVGTTTVNPSGLSTLTFSGGVPTDLDSAYVLEISSTGYWSTVISSTATSITINDVLPGDLPANTAVTVRKHNTVKLILGNNAPGLAAFNGETGDTVEILSPSQTLTVLSWVTTALGVPVDGWYNIVSTDNADDLVIEPGSAFIIRTTSATDLTFNSAGEVKLTPTQVDIFPNLTLVGQVNCVGNTLGGMSFASQLVQFEGENSDYDQLQFLLPSQTLSTNVALAPGILDPEAVMANLVTTEISENVVFSEGSGVIIRRHPSSSASVITLPGATVGP